MTVFACLLAAACEVFNFGACEVTGDCEVLALLSSSWSTRQGMAGPSDKANEVQDVSTSGIDALLACLDNDDDMPLQHKRTLPFGGSGAVPKKRTLPFGNDAPKRTLPRFQPDDDQPYLALPASTPIIYTRSPGECNELCSTLLQQHLPLVGMDIEWKV